MTKYKYTLAVLITTALMAISSQSAQVLTVQSDLYRPLINQNISITENVQTEIQCKWLYEGSEWDASGWTNLLAFGSGTGGIWTTNTPVGSLTTFVIDPPNIPTNGRYDFQVFAVQGATTQEWMRGNMTVRISPSKSYQPTNWYSGALNVTDFNTYTNYANLRFLALETNGTGGGGGDLSALSNGLSSVSNRLVTHTGLTTAAHGGIVADTDARLTNSRPPTAHTQDYTSITGAIPWLTVEADTNALAVVAALTNQVVYTNDARLTDARTPLAHNQAWGSITDAPAIPAQIADHTALTNQNGSTNFMHLTTAQVARVNSASTTNDTIQLMTNGTISAKFYDLKMTGDLDITNSDAYFDDVHGSTFSGNGYNITNILVAGVVGAVSNIIVNGTTGTVAAGVASVTIAAGGGGITNLTASTNSAGVAVQVDASNWTIGTSVVATASLDTNTVKALAQVEATNAVNDAGRYPYILASAPTTTLTRAMGNLVMLELTSNVTMFQIDNTGWSTNERAYGELDLDLKGFSFAWNTNVGQFSGTTTLVVPTNGMARFRWDGLPHRDTNTANKAVRQ